MVKKKAPRPKQRYAVYGLMDGKYFFLTFSLAVSAAQARNNARWNYVGETPADSLEYELVAVLKDSPEHKAILEAISPRPNEEIAELRRESRPKRKRDVGVEQLYLHLF